MVSDRTYPRPMPPLLSAALRAATLGRVIPLVPGQKIAAIKGWPSRASTDPHVIEAWWRERRYNIGIATGGPARLVVVDLDEAHGQTPPRAWKGARHGRDVLARRAERAGAPYPSDTYTVLTPSGGLHLYFKAPPGPELRDTQGRLGWHVDTRAQGGYIVAAGSTVRGRTYRVINPVAPATLPDWLATALAPPPRPESRRPVAIPAGQASGYIERYIARRVHMIEAAQPGTRHGTVLRAAAQMGRLVGAGQLADHLAVDLLRTACDRHIGVAGFTEREASATIADGIAWGRQRPLEIRFTQR